MNRVKKFLLKLTTSKEWYEKYSADLLFKEAYESFRTGDKFKAAGIFKQLAEKGNAKAQWALGGMYEGGFGVARDNKKALSLFTQAAEQGYIEAQYSLAKALESVEQEENNYKKYREKKLHWFQLLAREGHEEAQLWMANELGTLISDFPPGDDAEWEEQGNLMEEIITLFLDASLQGNGYAQYRLGIIYEQTLKDIASAYAWLAFSEAQEYEDASESKKEIASKLSTEEHSQAINVIKDIFKLMVHKQTNPAELGRAATCKISPALHFERMKKFAAMPDLNFDKDETKYLLNAFDIMARDGIK